MIRGPIFYRVCGVLLLVSSIRPMLMGKASVRGYYVEGTSAHLLGFFIFACGIVLIVTAVKKNRNPKIPNSQE
jgi:hypothetical protein